MTVEPYFSCRTASESLGVTADKVRRNAWRVPRVGIGKILRLPASSVEALRLIFDEQREVVDRAYNRVERDAVRESVLALTDTIECRARGWTYIATDPSHDDSPFKIGHTDGLAYRLWMLDRTSPFPLRYVALAAGSDYEGTLHRRYLKHRVRGEWFARECGVELVAAFAARDAGRCLRCVLERKPCRQ